MSDRLQRIADIISLLKDAEWEKRLDDEALDLIEVVVAGELPPLGEHDQYSICVVRKPPDPQPSTEGSA
jgi:hypothetical protein